ncbi:hypothetical protein ES706_05564 [subsurface metagenome]|nr:hypothetical protein [Bacillota bacterium]
MEFKGVCTAIGSLPHQDVDRACEIVLESFSQIPAWPQLPRRNLRENMYIQVSEGMPCLVLDEKKKKTYFRTKGDITGELEKFYQQIIEDRVDYFKISEDYAAGFYSLMEQVRKKLSQEKGEVSILALKGQLIGPISFGLTVTDENRKSILYHEQLVDAVVKTCVMKARWQVRRMKEVFPQIIIFIDEPYLASFGSAFVSLSRDEVVNYLNQVIDSIKSEGAIAGIHCCGNTDWSILMDTKVDIISFDAYSYLETISLYPEKLKEFLSQGRYLAWGIVPASSQVMEEEINSLIKRFEDGLKLLGSKGVERERILENLLITPSCGTGTLSVEVAEKVVKLTRGVSDSIKASYFRG